LILKTSEVATLGETPFGTDEPYSLYDNWSLWCALKRVFLLTIPCLFMGRRP